MDQVDQYVTVEHLDQPILGRDLPGHVSASEHRLRVADLLLRDQQVDVVCRRRSFTRVAGGSTRNRERHTGPGRDADGLGQRAPELLRIHDPADLPATARRETLPVWSGCGRFDAHDSG